MFLRLEKLPETRLIGMQLSASLVNNRVPELWRSFMPRRKEIKALSEQHLHSVQLLSDDYYSSFDPAQEFTRWAASAVDATAPIPEGMEELILPVGLYAVFLHKGTPASGAKTFGYIFREWLPSSGYAWENRPQFELLDERYRNNEADSEEEIWIPIKPV